MSLDIDKYNWIAEIPEGYRPCTDDWKKQDERHRARFERSQPFTEEELNDKFFLPIYHLEQTELDIAQEASKYIGRDSYSCLAALGPLTVNNAWQYNILIRFAEQTIQPVVWLEEGWWLESFTRWDQMPYVSTKDKSKIVYTPSTEYGRADRQIIIKVGKYLNQNFSEILDPNVIRFWATRHSELYGDHKLRFAITEDDIEWVYENGPISCMVMDRDNRYIESSIHPVRVYDSPDVAVAYLLKPNDKNRVMARTVINTKNKQWTTIYGDTHILGEVLRNHGYEQGGLGGCRLKRIEDEYDERGRTLCPYLDGDTTGIDYYRDKDGEWLLVTRFGDYTADSTSGYLNEPIPSFYCDCCGEDQPEDDACGTYSDGDVCYGCYENYYVNARYNLEYTYTGAIHRDYIISVRTQAGIIAYLEDLITEENGFIYHDGIWMTDAFYTEHCQQEDAA